MIQHEKFNSFFFKSIESFQNYKNNDKLKNTLGLLNNCFLIRIKDEKITFAQFKKLLDEYDHVLKEGHDENYERKKAKLKENEDKKKERIKGFKRDQGRVQKKEIKNPWNEKPNVETSKTGENKRDKETNKRVIAKDNKASKFKQLFGN